ncbi:MAG: hypothetical protein AAFU85_28790, partial [Planctomycetota bacterium]
MSEDNDETWPPTDHPSAQWIRLQELFAEVVTLSQSQRTAFLETACDGQDAIQTEIESLLKSYDAA